MKKSWAWKHKGAHSELVACAWLLKEGYEVFRNISQHGMVDIIAEKDGVSLRLDVKSDNGSNFQNWLSPGQVAAGILPLIVDANGGCRIGPSKPEPRPSRVCRKCGILFTPRTRSHTVFCSPRCSYTPTTYRGAA